VGGLKGNWSSSGKGGDDELLKIYLWGVQKREDVTVPGNVLDGGVGVWHLSDVWKTD